MEGNPFVDTEIADWKFLDSSPRSQCPKCKKSRKYYCYSCCLPLPHLAPSLPKVKLPVKVDIIKHPSETDGKSTAPHAVILAPDDVGIHTYPCIPDYDPKKVVLVFPGDNSLTLDELAAGIFDTNTAHSLCGVDVSNTLASDEQSTTHPRTTNPGSAAENSQNCVHDQQLSSSSAELLTCGNEKQLPVLESHKGDITSELKPTGGGNIQDVQQHKRSLNDVTSSSECKETEELPSKKLKMSQWVPFEKVVFIDATWNQTHHIVNDERLKSLKKVELRTRNSNFWRTQEGVPKTYLSTIEAIYYFLKDLHTLFIDSAYEHQYDNLLFFFCHIYNRIHNSSQRVKK